LRIEAKAPTPSSSISKATCSWRKNHRTLTVLPFEWSMALLTISVKAKLRI